MGTMSEEVVASMLRDFNLALIGAQLRREADLATRMDQPPTWRWSPGTFVFPEGLCCFCGGVMRSPCIFRAVNQQYHGSWKLMVAEHRGGGPALGWFAYDDTHPHVNEGSICMGNGAYGAGSVADALFLAFNPLSMYFGGGEDLSPNDQLKDWFADRFDHRCGSRLKVEAIGGVTLDHVVAPEAGCHCTHCRRHRGEIQCPRESCGEWYTVSVSHGAYNCDQCSIWGRRPLAVCFPHRHEFRDCVDCDARCDLWDINTDAPADPPPITQCEKCKRWVCDYCMSEEAGSYRHKCEEVDDEDDEPDEGHNCCGCNVCCECGAESYTED